MVTEPGHGHTIQRKPVRPNPATFIGIVKENHSLFPGCWTDKVIVVAVAVIVVIKL